MRSRTAALTLLVLGVLAAGCDQSREGRSPQGDANTTRSDPRIREGRAAVSKMIAAMGQRPDLAMMARILDQPDFSGVLREWGCIAIFDDAGKLVAAQTLKVVDFQTGKSHPVRAYSASELSEAREQILRYQKSLGTDPTLAFPILSNSIRLAVAAAATNEDTRIQFGLGRGAGADAEQLQVTKITGNSQTVVAADAVYAVERKQADSERRQPSLKYVTEWEFSSSGKALVEAVSIALTQSGNVVVPIPSDGAVRVYTPEGKLLTELSGLAAPAGVAVDGLGNLFVVESRGPSFRKYSASATGFTISNRDLGRSRLRYPTGIAINKGGHVYIGDKALKKILEFDNQGEFVRDVSSTDGPPAVLAWGATMGLIAWVGGELVRFRSGGEATERLPLGRDTPAGLAYDPTGDLLVTTLEGHLYLLEASGKVVGPIKVDSDLGVPFAVAGTHVGTMFVYDIKGFRIVRLVSSDAGR